MYVCVYVCMYAIIFYPVVEILQDLEFFILCVRMVNFLFAFNFLIFGLSSQHKQTKSNRLLKPRENLFLYLSWRW